MQWTRTKQWAAVGLLVLAAATTVVTAGTAGARGSMFYTGAGPPGTITGQVNGDNYLNTTNGDVYTLSGGVWNLTGNIRGPHRFASDQTHVADLALRTNMSDNAAPIKINTSEIVVPYPSS